MATISDGKNKGVSRREFLIGGSAAIAALALAACSRGTTAPVKTTSESSSTPNGTLTTLTTKYGSTLRIMGSFDAGNAGGWPSELMSQADDAQPCLEPLVRIDNKGNIVPWLAESYEIADDMKSVTFKLRQGVKFHDGSDFNAQVAKWNLDNVIAAKSKPLIASVDIVNDYTIQLNLTQWSNLIWSDLYDNDFVTMVSYAAYQKNGKQWMINNPIGTGPFKFVSYQSQVSYKVVHNPDYWGKDKNGNHLPYLDAIEIDYITDPFTQKTAMQTEVDDMALISAVSGKIPSEYKAIGFDVESLMGASLCFISDTANQDSPFASKEVREAVEYAIDREGIAKAFSYKLWPPTYQIPGPACAAYNPNFTLGRKYDPEKAKQLLAGAGYSNGFKTTIPVMPVALDQNIFVSIQSNLADVGIQAELHFPTSFPAWLGLGNSGVSVLNVVQFSDNNANFSVPLNLVLGKASIFNKNWLRTDEYLKLFDAAMASRTPDQNLIRAVTDYLVQEALVTPIASAGRVLIRQPIVMNYGWGETSVPAQWKPEQIWINK